jgi:hypothetical protein
MKSEIFKFKVKIESRRHRSREHAIIAINQVTEIKNVLVLQMFS